MSTTRTSATGFGLVAALLIGLHHDGLAQPPEAVVVPLPRAAPMRPANLPVATLLSLGNPAFMWEATGGPLGGLGYDIRLRPKSPDVVYVTDAWAGVFRSTNGGAFWHSPSGSGGSSIDVRKGLSNDAIPVFSLTIDPHNSNRIWVGMQDKLGIFRSDDGGQSWKRCVNGIVEQMGISFRGFTIHPNDSQIVYAAAEISSTAWLGGAGKSGQSLDLVKGTVYKTTDGGASWKRIWYDDNLARYVWINPFDPDELYLSTGIFDREAANSDPQKKTPGGVGVLKSTDGGKSFQPVNYGLYNLYVGSLFMHPKEPNVLLAGTGCNPYPQGAGIYLTENGGKEWQQVLSGEVITSVEFCVQKPNIAYAGSAESIWRSADGGHTWKRMNRSPIMWGPPGIRAGWPIDFQIDPRDPDRLWANAYGGGAFLSHDGGRTWKDASRGYTGAQVRRLAVDPNNPHRVVAAGRSGLFVTGDAGQSWHGLLYPPAFQLDWNGLAMDPDDPQHLLAGTSWGSAHLCESFDSGQSWRVAANIGVDKMGWRVIAFAPSKPSRVYAGTGSFKTAANFDNPFLAKGFYASDDRGHSWFKPNNVDPIATTAQVADLVVDPQFPMLVFAATTTHGMVKTIDGGAKWKPINKGLPAKMPVLSVAINPKARGILYCGLQGAGVYRSTDAGNPWQPLPSGMEPNAQVADIVLDPSDPDVVYAADLLSGVYRFVSGSGKWERINHGLKLRSVNALAFAPDGSILYAGTEGNGVYRLKLPGHPLAKPLPEQLVGPPIGPLIPDVRPPIHPPLPPLPPFPGERPPEHPPFPEERPPERPPEHPPERPPERPPEHPPERPPEHPPEHPPIREAEVAVQVMQRGVRGLLRPVPAAHVVIHWAGRPMADAAANHEGRAHLTLRQDSYEIRVHREGYHPYRGPLEVRRARVLRQVVLRRHESPERPPEERPPGERPPEGRPPGERPPPEHPPGERPPPEHPPGERPPAPQATLHVRVIERGPRGLTSPVPAAQIVIRWAGRPVAEQQANRGGEAVFRLRLGSYAIFVTRPGYARHEGPLEIRQREVGQTIVLRRAAPR